MHGATLRHTRIFGVLDNREIQLAAERQCLAHDVVVEDGLAVVGDGDGSSGLQRTKIAEGGAFAAARRSGDRKHISPSAPRSG